MITLEKKPTVAKVVRDVPLAHKGGWGERKS